MDLFGQQIFPLPLDKGCQATMLFWPQWLATAQADQLLAQSLTAIPWQSDSLHIAGRQIPVPRLHYWYGTARDGYRWSGLAMQARPFPDWLDQLRSEVEQACGFAFNRCLANYYRDGRDSVDWHSDDEKILGDAPVIASLSLGAERVFNLRHRLTRKRFDIALPHGSLLLMGAGMQQYWQHRIAKSKGLEKPRVNFTFRLVQPSV